MKENFDINTMGVKKAKIVDMMVNVLSDDFYYEEETGAKMTCRDIPDADSARKLLMTLRVIASQVSDYATAGDPECVKRVISKYKKDLHESVVLLENLAERIGNEEYCLELALLGCDKLCKYVEEDPKRADELKLIDLGYNDDEEDEDDLF